LQNAACFTANLLLTPGYLIVMAMQNAMSTITITGIAAFFIVKHTPTGTTCLQTN
jgi:hypothetical protein